MARAERLMAVIGVYGATGYTGHFVAGLLAQRGHHVVLGGRNPGRLSEMAAALPAGFEISPADIDDVGALQRFARRCAVIVNCAGPFSRYGQPVAQAAIAAGVRYVDHASQPGYVYRLMHELDAGARAAGVAIVPAMSFYTGVADLVVDRLTRSAGPLQRVAIAYAIDGWRLSPGSLATLDVQASADSVVYRDRAVQLLAPTRRPTLATFEFPPPIGVQPVITPYAGSCEAVTVPRHTDTDAVHTCITSSTFAGIAPRLSGGTPTPQVIDDGTTRFSIVVDAYSAAGRLRNWISGAGDLYEIGALISVYAAELLAAGRAGGTGVLSPAEAFAETPLLDELLALAFFRGGLQADVPGLSTPEAIGSERER
jgi:Saccharopine dehydrogenase NADP binding domain